MLLNIINGICGIIIGILIGIFIAIKDPFFTVQDYDRNITRITVMEFTPNNDNYKNSKLLYDKLTEFLNENNFDIKKTTISGKNDAFSIWFR